MPAKTKYLSSTSQRFSKVIAAILGGYVVTLALHMAVGIMLEDKSPLVMTTAYSAFLLWVFFMILTFLMKKAWHVWTLFILITFICTCIIYIYK